MGSVGTGPVGLGIVTIAVIVIERTDVTNAAAILVAAVMCVSSSVSPIGANSEAAALGVWELPLIAAGTISAKFVATFIEQAPTPNRVVFTKEDSSDKLLSETSVVLK